MSTVMPGQTIDFGLYDTNGDPSAYAVSAMCNAYARGAAGPNLPKGAHESFVFTAGAPGTYTVSCYNTGFLTTCATNAIVVVTEPEMDASAESGTVTPPSPEGGADSSTSEAGIKDSGESTSEGGIQDAAATTVPIACLLSTFGQFEPVHVGSTQGPIPASGAIAQVWIPQGNLGFFANGPINSFTMLSDLSLHANGSTPLPHGSVVNSMAATPDAKYLYAAGLAPPSDGGVTIGVDSGSPNVIYQFSIAGTGLAAPLSTPTAPLSFGYANATVIDPAGTSLYVALSNTGIVESYAIGSSGALTPIAAMAVGSAADSIAISSDGTSVYVLDSEDGYVAQYTRASDGTLSPKTPAQVAIPSAVDAGAIDYGGSIVLADVPGATYAYVLLTRASTLSSFTVAPGGLVAGAAAPIMQAAYVPQQQGCQNMAVDTIDNEILIACPQDDTLRGYLIGPAGGLTAASWSPLSTNLSTNGSSGPVYIDFLRATF